MLNVRTWSRGLPPTKRKYKWLCKAATKLTLCVFAIIGSVYPTMASEPRVQRAVTPAAVEKYVDTYLKRAMAEKKLVGVTVSVVHGGKKIFSKGYGYADLKARRRVSSSDSIFMIGSVTKLFTATATMQLLESNRLKLDRDVGNYLDFSFPRYSRQPITMHHLMTHTAGFEESFLGFVGTRAEILPLGQMLKRTMPHVRIVREPGAASSYSNHGVSLEGYVVERAAGLPYHNYINDKILLPLGMNSSTAQEPIKESWRQRLARGYSFDDGKYVLLPEDIVNHGPSGSIASTADDMAWFMLAHLGQGRIGDRVILKPESAALMHKCHYRAHPLIQGCSAYAFQKSLIAGNPVIEHNGGTFNFASNLVLVPEENFGIFLSVNSPDDGNVTAELPKAIIDYFMGKVPAPAPLGLLPYADNLVDYEGYYTPMRRLYGGWLKISGIGAAKVSRSGPTSLNVEGSDTKWYQVGKGAFRSRDKAAEGVTLTFTRDGSGKVIGASLGDGFDKVPFYATQAFALPVLSAFFGMAVIFAIYAFFARKTVFAAVGGVRHIRRSFGGGLSFFVLGLGVIAAVSVNEKLAFGYAPPLIAHAMIWMFNLAALCFMFGTIKALAQWRNPSWSMLGRTITGVVIAVIAAMIWFLWTWDLIGLSAWG